MKYLALVFTFLAFFQFSVYSQNANSNLNKKKDFKWIKDSLVSTGDSITRIYYHSIQKDKNKRDSIAYSVITEEKPMYPGGAKAFFKYLNESIIFPDSLKRKGVHGEVITSFVVDSTGFITDVKIVKGLNPVLDSNCFQIIQSMPAWRPGLQQGRPVKVKYTVPIKYKLD